LDCFPLATLVVAIDGRGYILCTCLRSSSRAPVGGVAIQKTIIYIDLDCFPLATLVVVMTEGSIRFLLAFEAAVML